MECLFKKPDNENTPAISFAYGYAINIAMLPPIPNPPVNVCLKLLFCRPLFLING